LLGLGLRDHCVVVAGDVEVNLVGLDEEPESSGSCGWPWPSCGDFGTAGSGLAFGTHGAAGCCPEPLALEVLPAGRFGGSGGVPGAGPFGFCHGRGPAPLGVLGTEEACGSGCCSRTAGTGTAFGGGLTSAMWICGGLARPGCCQKLSWSHTVCMRAPGGGGGATDVVGGG
jgi:hypothetical protein